MLALLSRFLPEQSTQAFVIQSTKLALGLSYDYVDDDKFER
jgi:hypothetical protein